MCLYHAILVLSALMLAMNVSFQVAWLDQFEQVRESVDDFGKSWLPAVRACGELTRHLNEFRRYELRYAIAESQQEMASLARSMGRQTDRIRGAEARLDGLLGTRAERDAFAVYLNRKREYLAGNRDVLVAMMEGAGHGAMATVKASGAAFSAMAQDIQAVEAIVNDMGDEAVREAGRRSRRVRLNMLAAGAAGIALGLAASILAARRLSRPLGELARFMAAQKTPREGGPPPPPSLATSEVSTLYRSFADLSGRLARSMERLEILNVTDQLTGVANRRKLMEEGSSILDICRRGGQECSVLMMDIDHFKGVNDSLGHAAGDAVLREVARELQAGVRGSDLLARYGGEEFALVAPNSGLEEARLLAERLRAGVEGLVVETPAGPVRVTVSVGVAGDGEGVDGLEQLLDRADKALYRAKEGGRNRVEE